MDVVFVTPELSPFRAGGFVAETVAGAAKSIRQLGHRVTVISPLWGDVDPDARHLARRLARIEVASRGETLTLALYEGKSAAGVDLVMLGHADLFPAGTSASETGSVGARRWGAFLRGVMAVLRRRDARPDVVQLQGWQAAPLAILLREDEAHARVPAVLSLDAPGAHGLFERSALDDYGLLPRHFGIEGVEFYGRFSALKAGVQNAATIIVPGPSAARSVVEPGGATASELPSAGLEGALKSRGRALVGIVPGVDAAVWNAATDPHLAARFDATDLKKTGPTDKGRCKAALQQELGLVVRDDVMLLGAALTEAEGAGLDRLVAALPTILRNDVHVAIAVEGPSGPLGAQLVALRERFADRLAVRVGAEADLVHRVIGGADALVVPAPADPCAMRPMHAHRYGTLPIVRRLGLAADSVVDCDAQLASGNGFLFDGADEASLVAGVQRALAAFTDPRAYRRAQARAIAADHGWERAARLYERVYRSLEAARVAATPPL